MSDSQASTDPYANLIPLLGQHRRLRALALAIVGEDNADDVVQDVWLAALSKGSQGVRNGGAWLTGVTRHLAWKRREREGQRRARELEADRVWESEDAQAWLLRIERGHAVERALGEVQEPYRLTLLWRFYGDLSIQEIARRRGLSESAVRSQLSRGLARLRERLQQREGTDWRALVVPLVHGPQSLVESGAVASAIGTGGWLAKTVLILVLCLCLVAGIWQGLKSSAGLHGEAVAGMQPTEAAAGLHGLPRIAGQDLFALKLARGPEEVRQSGLSSKVGLESDQGGERTQPEAPQSDGVVVPWKVVLPGSQVGVAGVWIRLHDGERNCRGRSDASGGLAVSMAYEQVRPGEMQSKQGKTPIVAEWGSDGAEGEFSGLCRILAPERDGDAARIVLMGTHGFRVQLSASVAQPGIRAAVRRPVNTQARAFDLKRYKPLQILPGEVSFLIPPQAGSQGGGVFEGEMEVFLGVPGQGFFGSAWIPASATLSDAPYPMDPIDWVPQHFRVSHAETGAPIEGAYVSARSVSDRWLMAAASYTDGEGQATIDGLPAGQILIRAGKQGFQLSRGVEMSYGGQSEYREIALQPLEESPGLQVSVTCESGPLPQWVAIHGSPETNISMPVEARAEFHARPGGGWTAEAVLEGLPEGKARVLCYTNLPGEGERGWIDVQLPSGPVSMRLKGEDLLPLDLVLPQGIEEADFWVVRGGTFRRQSVSARSSSVVGNTISGERRTPWMVFVPGYVPAWGYSRVWAPVPANKPERYEVRPRLQRGWGLLVQVRGPQDFYESDVRLETIRGHSLLATTDAQGFALIQAPEPITQIRLRKGDRHLLVKLPARGFMEYKLQ